MKEDFLHLLWQQQLHFKHLETLSNGLPVNILKTGYRNPDSGPDFNQAKIVIDRLEWVGSVEIHVKASEWNLHGHTQDPAYQSVILHVVWEKDTDVYRLDGTIVPTFELKDKVPLDVLLRYRELMNPTRETIPCAAFVPTMVSIRMTAMQERVLTERLERKASLILQRWEQNRNDWLETFYQSLAFTLGLKINSDPMLVLAQSIPYKVLATSASDIHSTYILLLGQAGFLNNATGEAGRKLAKEFGFLNRKFRLERSPMVWKKFRIRPGSFPVRKVVVLASLVPFLKVWMQSIETARKPKELLGSFQKQPLPEDISLFLTETGHQSFEPSLSLFQKNALVINLFAPFLAAIGLSRGENEPIEKALDWLSELKPEPNRITKLWEELGIECSSGAQSQALTELYNEYCSCKRCMECAMGLSFLSTSP